MELLNAREHLELFCEIRGIKRKFLKEQVEKLRIGMGLKMNGNNLVVR